MIDPNIIIRGAERAQEQQAQNMQELGKFGQLVGSIALQNRANQMRQLSSPEERRKFANNSIFAPMLNAALKSDEAAAQKAFIEQQKAQSEIAKTNSEAFKNTQQAQGYGLDNSGKKYGAIQGAFQQAAMTGDKTQVLLGLDALQRTGMIAPEDYQHQFEIVKAMNPEDVKQYASGIALNNKDVAPYLFQTQNNVADNKTSRENNQATVGATIRGQDVAAQTAANSLEQQKNQFNQNFEYQKQQDEIKNNQAEIKEFGGKAYIVYKNGDYKPALDANGQQIIAMQKANGQPKLSDKALGQVNEINIQLSTANQNKNKISGLISDVEDGKLNLSAANQLGAKALNSLGMSNENTRGVENFQTALNQAVNDVLMMAKGTQTEGDAQRAAAVISANPPRDNASALQVLKRLAAIQQNTIDVLNNNANVIYDNYRIPRPNSSNQEPSVGEEASRAVQSASSKWGI